VKLVIRSDLGKVGQTLGKAQAKVALAIVQGLNEGGDLVRTRVQVAMKHQTSLLRLKSVTSRQREIRAFDGSLSYTIVYAGKPSTRPSEFRTQAKRGPGGGVTITMWGKPHKFQRSFKSSVLGILRARLGPSRMPIRGFDGPNLAKEAVKDEVAQTFLNLADLLVAPAIDKRLARLL
jgi:hypothetical protein